MLLLLLGFVVIPQKARFVMDPLLMGGYRMEESTLLRPWGLGLVLKPSFISPVKCPILRHLFSVQSAIPLLHRSTLTPPPHSDHLTTIPLN